MKLLEGSMISNDNVCPSGSLAVNTPTMMSLIPSRTGL